MIVGIAGKKHVGKTTAAKALLSGGFRPYSFARTIKRMVRVLLVDCGLSYEQIAHYEAEKEEVIPLLGVSFRDLCQTLGTDWGRERVNRDLWIITAKYGMASAEDYVIDDVRFENEAALIRSTGGLIIHLQNPLVDNTDTHVSESGIAIADDDALLVNDGSKEALHESIWACVNEHVHAIGVTA